MKKIGVLGGMAPESTLEYYRLLNAIPQKENLEEGYPEIIIYSVNFDKFRKIIKSKDESEAISLLSGGIKSLERAGADFALIASNTPHKFFGEVDENSSIPLLSIVDATGEAAEKKGFEKLGLLGTKITMEGDFYKEVLDKWGINTVSPSEENRGYIDNKISEELTEGKFKEETKNGLIKTVKELEERENVEAVILGCTELPLILDESDLNIPILNTARIHARKAIDYATEK